METGAHHISSQWFEENLTVKLKSKQKLNHIISWTRSYLCFTCIIGSPYKLIRKTDHFNEMHSGTCWVPRDIKVPSTVTINSPIQEIFCLLSLHHNLLSICFGVMRCHNTGHKLFLSTIDLNSTIAVSDLLLKIIVLVNLCYLIVELSLYHQRFEIRLRVYWNMRSPTQ